MRCSTCAWRGPVRKPQKARRLRGSQSRPLGPAPQWAPARARHNRVGRELGKKGRSGVGRCCSHGVPRCTVARETGWIPTSGPWGAPYRPAPQVPRSGPPPPWRGDSRVPQFPSSGRRPGEIGSDPRPPWRARCETSQHDRRPPGAQRAKGTGWSHPRRPGEGDSGSKPGLRQRNRSIGPAKKPKPGARSGPRGARAPRGRRTRTTPPVPSAASNRHFGWAGAIPAWRGPRRPFGSCRGPFLGAAGPVANAGGARSRGREARPAPGGDRLDGAPRCPVRSVGAPDDARAAASARTRIGAPRGPALGLGARQRPVGTRRERPDRCPPGAHQPVMKEM